MTVSDCDLLHQYMRKGSEGAFAELVSRHLNLVHSAALRQTRQPQLAEEVAQSVFVELCRSADKVSAGGSLSAWLYQAARRRAIDVVRRESRRQLREQIAMEQTDRDCTASEWSHIEPMLDEAMATLGEKDRAAILLRYFENRSLREVGETLGSSEDAAQKRVSRALDGLRAFFSKRKVAVGASGLATMISANAVQAAPLALSGTISSAALLAGAALHTATTVGLATAITMTTIQKTLIALAITAALGTSIYQSRRAAQLEAQIHTMEQQQAPSSAQLRQWRQDRDRSAARVAMLEKENARLRGDSQALAQVKAQDAAAASDPTQQSMLSWLDRVDKLKQSLSQTPGAMIPEMQLLTEQDWLNAVRGKLETEADYLQAFSSLRNTAESKLTAKTYPALQKFLQANGGGFPADLAQLQPYFESPAEGAMLQRWEIVPASNHPNMQVGADWVITQKAAVDVERDTRIVIGASGHGAEGGGFDPSRDALMAVAAAYAAANAGREPANLTDLLPYATTPAQQESLRRKIEMTGK